MGNGIITHPPILYKYRTWSNPLHQKVLKECSVYLSPPKDFEDKMDCNPSYVYPIGIDIFRYLLNYKKELPFRQRVEFAAKWYKVSPLNYPDELIEIKNLLDDEFNSHFGILSLSATSNNDYLWEHYSDKHKGFCVGFDWNKITFFIRGGGKVAYVDKLPVIDLIKDNDDTKIVKTIIYKEKKWEKEEEYRLFKVWLPNDNKILREVRLPVNAIVEIILGKEMCKEYKNEIKSIAVAKYPHAKVIER